MVSDQAVERILTMSKCYRVHAIIALSLVTIYSAIDFGSLSIEVLPCLNTILFLQHLISRNKGCESLLLLIGSSSSLTVHVRSILHSLIVLGVVAGVTIGIQRVDNLSSAQCLGKDGYGRILHQNIGKHTATALQHTAYRMYDTILHLFVLCSKEDVSRAVEIHHCIPIAVNAVSDFNVATVHIGCGQCTIGHVSHLVNILHQVSTCNRIAVLIGQLINGAKSSLAQICLERIIMRSKAGIMAIYRQRLEQFGSLKNSCEVAKLFARLEILTHHLACESIVVRCVYIIATVKDARSQYKLQQQ